MATTGFLLPTTDTAVSGSWSSTTNVQAKDGSVASSTIAAKNTTASRDCGGFGFSTAVLPDGATISKVEIRPKWRVSTNGSIATLRVNGKVGVTVLANHDNAAEPTTLTEETFDVTADRAWAPADMRDGTFFVRFNAVQGNSATSCTYEFDSIEVQVTYTVVNTLEQVSFRGRNDDGSESAATWKAALNTAWNQAAALFRVRVLAKCTAGGTTQDFKWQRTLMTAQTQIANTTGGTNQALGNSAVDGRRFGQSFTTPSVDDGDYFITSAIFRFRAVGSPTDDIQCFITSALSGETVLHAATATVAPRDTVNYAEFTFSFSSANLTPATKYYIKCKRTGAESGTNYYQMDVTLTNPYSGGELIRYSAASADWVVSAGNEAYFKVDGQGKMWGDVPAQGTGSVPIRYAASSNVTDAGATTQQLGAGTFKAGLIYETANASTVAYTAANDETEIEAVFEAVSGQVTVGDTYKFRAIKKDGTAFGTYTQTPQITIATGSTYTLTASTGSFTLTGIAAGLRADRRLSSAMGSFTLTGIAAALRADRRIGAVTGSFALTGNAAGLRADRRLPAATGSFTLTGNSAGLRADRRLVASPGAFSETGNDAALMAARLLAAGTGTFVVTGNDATLTYVPSSVPEIPRGGGGSNRIRADEWRRMYDWLYPEERKTKRKISRRSYKIDKAELPIEYVMYAEPGRFAVTFFPAVLAYHRVMQTRAGEFDVIGGTARLIYERDVIEGDAEDILAAILNGELKEWI